MKKIISSIMLVALITILAACGSSSEGEENNASENKEPVMTEVEVKFEEEPLPVKEESVIKAVVTQGEEKVTGADSVEFEIWHTQSGQEKSDTIAAEHTESGVYEAAYTFDKPGTYQVIAHTQARSMHVMPQVEVQVKGDEAAKEESGHDQGKEGHASKEDSHGHGHSNFMVHFMKDQEFKAAEDSTLTAHINHKEQPFEEAMVKFEISSAQLDKHKFIPAEETNPGEYTSAYTFSSAGEYTVTIHYEKPDQEIHGHQEETIQVSE
ncbi:FixH family protein [Halobacillus amylolyticus]|uniref:FixH family protein n=1 Tax=Halobacillus amylolyticus TaxID=2932259 RepID=A0ABY4HEU3_9BACI|nr:FixH family protein [Halobacillus amylolyticus]UOR13387.1 FixH family protein [Halobacillus amylolyticus]